MKNEIQFIVPARKYFEADAERLEQTKDSDICIVTIDFKNQKADYIWYNPDAVSEIDRNPANHPAIEDDFEGVVKLWEELGKPLV